MDEGYTERILREINEANPRDIRVKIKGFVTGLGVYHKRIFLSELNNPHEEWITPVFIRHYDRDVDRERVVEKLMPTQINNAIVGREVSYLEIVTVTGKGNPKLALLRERKVLMLQNPDDVPGLPPYVIDDERDVVSSGSAVEE